MLFDSLAYNRSAAYKYLPYVANNSIQIYSAYNYIGLIGWCLNYDY
jgi:hypothetical protein